MPEPPAPDGPVPERLTSAIVGAVPPRNPIARGRGLYLGQGAGGWAWSGPERSVLVLGPSRSGKTSSLVIPNVVLAEGAVVTTSTKPDVLRRTAAARAAAGHAFLFDPGGTVEPPHGVTRIGWSPVNGSGRWDAALATASAMVRSASLTRYGQAPSTGADHWTERAGALLAPLLHAAALGGQPMATVASWVDRHRGEAALELLADRVGDEAPATDLLAGILATDDREQSGIWSTASGVLSAYRTEGARTSTYPPFLDVDAFCDGANTLYVCAPGHHQALFAPMVVGLIDEIRTAAYRRAAEPSGSSRPPVLLALDEAANIAPLPDLPAMVSEGAGQGLVVLACLQDLSQARRRWGPEADAFVSLFGTTMVLGGIADRPTLEIVSALGGEAELLTRTISTSAGTRRTLQRSISVSGTFRSRLPLDAVARGREGQALVVDPRNRLGWVGLTPVHRSGPWRSILGLGRQAGLTGPGDRPPDMGRGR